MKWLTRGSLAVVVTAACGIPTAEDSDLRVSAATLGGGAAPTVTTFNPKEGVQGTTLDVAVTGTGYDQSSAVTLLLDGKATAKVKTNSTTLVSPTDLVANITIAADAVLGNYQVQVANAGGKKGIGIESFAVLQPGSPPGQWDPPQVVITFGQGSTGTDAVRGDDAANSPYPDPGHIAVNGNLMFWLGVDHPRSARVTTFAFDGATRDRIYTNNHTNPGGDNAFGLLGMVEGSTGSAVLEVELDDNGIVRYGKDCSGSFGAVVPATKAVTTRSADGRTWTITGTTGVHCKQVTKKPGMTQVGTTGPFSMTLVWP